MDPFTIRSILVGTDLSHRSDTPLRAAAAIAELTGAELHVIHAFELERLPSDQVSEADTFPGRVETARHLLDEQLRRVIPDSQAIASREVEIFAPHKAILVRAREVVADVIVLGRHGDRRLADRILGTTADHVVRAAGVPCLVVPERFRLPLHRVVLPIDPGAPAPVVVRLATAWASGLGAGNGSHAETELHLLAILAGAAGVTGPVHEGGAESVLKSCQESVSVPENVSMRRMMRSAPSPADGILAYAAEIEADLIAMGTRAPRAVERTIIGSVASEVARGAPAPVLLIPPALWRGSELS